jgi:flagellin-like protein
MLNFKQNEDAVSPVIGVILMVAITVILAAVIAAFVFGMTGTVTTTKNVVVTATQTGSDIIVNYKGGADASTLYYLKVTVNDGTSAASGGSGETTLYGYVGETEFTTANDISGVSFTSAVPVGETIKFVNEGSSARNHVVVVGHFADGSENVVLDTYV